MRDSRSSSNRARGAFLVTHLVPIALLLWALSPTNPYAYYTFLRIVCCGCFVVLAIRSHESQSKYWLATFVGLAVVYNPVFRVHLDRAFWSIVNILTVAILVASILNLRRTRQE